MALADEALAHHSVLVSLVAAFCEADARQLIHQIEIRHEGAQGPGPVRLEKPVEEAQDALDVLGLVVDLGQKQELAGRQARESLSALAGELGTVFGCDITIMGYVTGLLLTWSWGRSWPPRAARRAGRSRGWPRRSIQRRSGYFRRCSNFDQFWMLMTCLRWAGTC